MWIIPWPLYDHAQFISYFNYVWSQDVVGIVTNLRAGWSRFSISLGIRDLLFSKMSRQALGHVHCLVLWIPRLFPRDKAASLRQTTHHKLVPRLRDNFYFFVSILLDCLAQNLLCFTFPKSHSDDKGLLLSKNFFPHRLSWRRQWNSILDSILELQHMWTPLRRFSQHTKKQD